MTFIGSYQAHHFGEVTDMAALYHYQKSAQTSERLVAYLMGPANEELGVQPKEIDYFKAKIEYLIRNCIDELKESLETVN